MQRRRRKKPSSSFWSGPAPLDGLAQPVLRLCCLPQAAAEDTRLPRVSPACHRELLAGHAISVNLYQKHTAFELGKSWRSCKGPFGVAGAVSMEVSGWVGVCTGARAGGRRGVPLQLDGDSNTVPTSQSQIPPLVFVQEGKGKQELLWRGCSCQLEANNGKRLVLRACSAWSWGESPWELRGAPRNADWPGGIVDCSSLG